MGGKVEREVAELDFVDHDLALAARDGAQACEKLLGLKGLGHVVVGAGVKAFDLVLGGVECREHEDGRRDAGMTQLVNHVVAVHAGKHYVKDDRVIETALRARETRRAVVDGLGVVFCVRQNADNGISEVSLVFDNEYVHEGSSLICVLPG